MRETSVLRRLNGNNHRKKEYRLKRKRHNKQKELNKKEKKLKRKKFELMLK